MRNWVVAMLVTMFFCVPVCGAEIATTDFSNNNYSVLTRSETINTELMDQSAGFVFDFKSLEEGADDVRSQFLYNIGNVTVKVWAQSSNPETVYNELLKETYKETENSDEGDYLRWSIKSQQVAYNRYRYIIGGAKVYCYEFNINVDYYITLEQKNNFNEKVSEVIEEFGFDGATSEYEKVETIYDYICENVVYAHDLSDEVVFSAYSALFNGKAVCQGYAQLFYKMGRESGLDVRIIPGYSNNGKEHHGWNIVRIGELYYNLDTTWDSSCKQTGSAYNYFLKGDSFGGHVREDDFDTVEFHHMYPMSSTDYYVTLDTVVSSEDATKLEGFNDIKPTIKVATRKKVKLAKISGATKYQIKYSTSKKLNKKVKTASTNKTTYKFSDLKKDKNYYVKVRAYKVVNGKKISTQWSKVRRVKS